MRSFPWNLNKVQSHNSHSTPRLYKYICTYIKIYRDTYINNIHMYIQKNIQRNVHKQYIWDQLPWNYEWKEKLFIIHLIISH